MMVDRNSSFHNVETELRRLTQAAADITKHFEGEDGSVKSEDGSGVDLLADSDHDDGADDEGEEGDEGPSTLEGGPDAVEKLYVAFGILGTDSSEGEGGAGIIVGKAHLTFTREGFKMMRDDCSVTFEHGSAAAVAGMRLHDTVLSIRVGEGVLPVAPCMTESEVIALLGKLRGGGGALEFTVLRKIITTADLEEASVCADTMAGVARVMEVLVRECMGGRATETLAGLDLDEVCWRALHKLAKASSVRREPQSPVRRETLSPGFRSRSASAVSRASAMRFALLEETETPFWAETMSQIATAMRGDEAPVNSGRYSRPMSSSVRQLGCALLLRICRWLLASDGAFVEIDLLCTTGALAAVLESPGRAAALLLQHLEVGLQ